MPSILYSTCPVDAVNQTEYIFGDLGIFSFSLCFLVHLVGLRVVYLLYFFFTFSWVRFEIESIIVLA